VSSNSKFKTQNSKLQKLAGLLLAWFSANARDLPWRRTRDPYAIWVSEIMLQQTQVKTVISYWNRWMRELPIIEAVTNASPDKIHKLWEGLGYYTRARNLQKAAKQIVEKHGCMFPQNFADLLALPGIGRYTAGAICSIAFNQPTPILDGNVIRVLTRVFGIGGNPRETKTNAWLWQLAEELVVHASRFTFLVSHSNSRTRTKGEDDMACSSLNQSLMELGALVCTPRNPQCEICPVKKLCVAFREGRVGELPNLGKREAATARRFVAFVVERNERFLVRQRPAGVVNAHLWEFPNVESSDAKTDLKKIFKDIVEIELPEVQPLCTVKHSITRYRITLEAFHIRLGGMSLASQSRHNYVAPIGTFASRAVFPRPHPKETKSGTCKTRPSESGDVWLPLAKLIPLAFTSAHRKVLSALKTRSGW
jgi:A/G-specific adenine glycosylase